MIKRLFLCAALKVQVYRMPPSLREGRRLTDGEGCKFQACNSTLMSAYLATVAFRSAKVANFAEQNYGAQMLLSRSERQLSLREMEHLAVGESGLTAWPCNTSPKRQRVNTSEAQYVHSLALRLVVGRIQHSF